MPDPSQLLADSADAEATAWLRAATERVCGDGTKILPELFPQLPRRLSRDPLTAGFEQVDDARVDFGAWRRCDAGAWALLAEARPRDEQLMDLFWHGDMEERTMVMRCLACLPISKATVDLLGEAQRTNTVPHFEAAVCDSNLLARTMAAGRDDFGIGDHNRMILKLAFIDLPLARVLDYRQHANADLSQMLQGLATEREAAGRVVWRDTNRLIALAPTDGTVARLAGGLEHGDDNTRLATAEGLADIDNELLRTLARERLDREPRAEIREALQRATGKS